MRNQNKQKRMFQQKKSQNPPTAFKFGVRPSIFKFILVSQYLLWAFLKLLYYAKPREKNITH